MRAAALLALTAAAGASDLEVTNLLALAISAVAALAGVAAFIRARAERPKIVAEAAHIGHTDLRAELETAWEALDRERKRAATREHELELDAAYLRKRIRAVERERDCLEQRVTILERIVGDAGLGPVQPGH